MVLSCYAGVVVYIVVLPPGALVLPSGQVLLSNARMLQVCRLYAAAAV